MIVIRFVFLLLSLFSLLLLVGVIRLWIPASQYAQLLTADAFAIGFCADKEGIHISGGRGNWNPFQAWEYVALLYADVSTDSPFYEPMHDDVVGALGIYYLPPPDGPVMYGRFESLAILLSLMPLIWIVFFVRRRRRKTNPDP